MARTVLHSYESGMKGMGGGYRSGPGRVAELEPRLFWGAKKTGARAALQKIGYGRWDIGVR